MYAMFVVNEGSPFCLCSTTWWATMAVSGSEKVLCALVCCSVGSACVCVCLFVCMRVCCHQMNFFVFQCNSDLSHCTCFTLGGVPRFSNRVGMVEIRCVEYRRLIQLSHTNAKRLMSRRVRCSLSFRIVSIEIQCMQCLRCLLLVFHQSTQWGFVAFCCVSV